MKLGRYEIVRELGKGAMGVVYLAKDPVIGRLVALKTIRTGQHADDDDTKEFQARFVREAQAAGILNHPSIVTVHDIGADEATGTSFIAMEFVEGNNLREVLQQGRPLSFSQLGDLIAQIADALDFAHAKGIVHRDVKPANIIVLDNLKAKIMDFGIAKIASGGANLTSTGQFLGTPNYMAPEQIKGAPVDGRTDIFALGICLYECLTRRKPFGGDSLTAISYKIVHEPFPPLKEINPQIPAGYEEVIAKCLEKDPGRRFQRARDLANALRAVIAGEKPNLETGEAEQTIVTSSGSVAAMHDTSPGVGAGATAINRAAAVAAEAPAVLATQFKKTVKAVHSIPVLGLRIPTVAFIAIVALLIAGFGVSYAMLKARTKSIPEPVVDTRAEAQRQQERELRNQANAFLRAGNTAAAYAKYEELRRLAPNSPAVNQMLESLNAARANAEIGRQQEALARQKFDEGMSYYNEQDFEHAIPLLQDAFSINPSSDEIARYLQSAKDQQARLDQEKATRGGGKLQSGLDDMLTDPTAPAPTSAVPAAAQARGARGAAAPAAGGAAAVAPSSSVAQLSTSFNSPWADGYITVSVGPQLIVKEDLFEERGKLMFRRKYSKGVNITKTFAPGPQDLEVWVVVPSAGVQEHHIIRRVSFQPGSAHRLAISADGASKKFSYQLN